MTLITVRRRIPAPDGESSVCMYLQAGSLQSLRLSSSLGELSSKCSECEDTPVSVALQGFAVGVVPDDVHGTVNSRLT